MGLRSFDQFVARIGTMHFKRFPLYGEIAATLTGPIGTTGVFNHHVLGYMEALPSLPSGVTAYIPTRCVYALHATPVSLAVARLTNMGSIDISGASGTFTDGNAAPTVTECGVSRQRALSLWVEPEVALSSLPGLLSVTYVDQSGNAAEATAVQTLTASAALRGFGPIVLNQPDTGVLDVTAATRSGGTTPTGTLRFWGIDTIAMLQLPNDGGQQLDCEDFLMRAFNPIRLGAGDIIRVLHGSGAVRTLVGDLYVVGDN